MHNRLRLLKGATALLYFGALLAGLVGHGWEMVPLFLVIFVLWSVILRPQLWPKKLRDLGQSDAFVAVASLVATQALLVILCFAFGRGIGGVLGFKPVLPEYLPLAISFLSVPLSRLLWNPRVIAQNAGFDPLLHGTNPVRVDKAGQGMRMLTEVMALPDTVREDELQPLMTTITSQSDPAEVRKFFATAVAENKITRAGRKAMILHATEPGVSHLLSGSGYPAQAFAVAGLEGELQGLFARRSVMTLGDAPELAGDFPSAEAVAQAARDLGEDRAALVLRRLVGLLEQSRGVDDEAR